MIPDTTDRSGQHSLRLLLRAGIERFPDDMVLSFLYNKDHIVAAVTAQMVRTPSKFVDRAFTEAIKLSKEKAAFRRELSTYILGQLGPPEFKYKDQSVPILTRLCADTSGDVRGGAIVALGHLEAGDCKDIILDALNDTDESVIESAAFSLWKLGLTSDDKKLMEAASKQCSKRTRESIEDYIDDLSRFAL